MEKIEQDVFQNRVRIERLDERVDSIEEIIKEIRGLSLNVNSLALEVKGMASDMKEIRSELKEQFQEDKTALNIRIDSLEKKMERSQTAHGERLGKLENKGSQWFDKIIDKVVMGFLAAIIAYVCVKIGL